MNKQLREVCVAGGIDYDAAMERFFDDEDMYIEFLEKFIEDDTLGRIQAFAEAGDAGQAFEAAHKFKGVCANLSLVSINAVLDPMVEVLRRGSMEGVSETVKELSAVCEKMSGTIRKACEAYKQQA